MALEFKNQDGHNLRNLLITHLLVVEPSNSPLFMTPKTPYPESKEKTAEIRESVHLFLPFLLLAEGSKRLWKKSGQTLGDCKRCKLCSTRTNIVFGAGDAKARLVFVGEGPGADEDLEGLPFVGRAGQLLTKIIEAIRSPVTRSISVTSSNVVPPTIDIRNRMKWRPALLSCSVSWNPSGQP